MKDLVHMYTQNRWRGVHRDQGDLCCPLLALTRLTALRLGAGLDVRDRELNAIRQSPPVSLTYLI